MSKAHTIKGLSVHKTESGKTWTVTHIASGKRVPMIGFELMREAVVYATALADHADWTVSETDMVANMETYRSAKRAADDAISAYWKRP